GFTSTEKTFNVGFAWITNEKEDNFTWDLQQCRSLLRSEDIRPKVNLTDRDTTLMNAVAEVFPTSAALVCRFHVEKNDLLDSPTEEDYVDAVVEFRKLCAKWPRLC
ncbi:putative transposase, partial [Trifolium medium]|nr:putative transposase [Trifolium medium]